MEDLDTCYAVGFFYPGDGKAGAVLAGVATGGEGQADGIAGVPERVAFDREGGGKVQDIHDIFVHEHDKSLCLWITEAGIVLQ